MLTLSARLNFQADFFRRFVIPSIILSQRIKKALFVIRLMRIYR